MTHVISFEDEMRKKILHIPDFEDTLLWSRTLLAEEGSIVSNVVDVSECHDDVPFDARSENMSEARWGNTWLGEVEVVFLEVIHVSCPW